MTGSRFGLHEYNRPNYAEYLPEKDPNNAIWPRISLIAKMLNEIPWGKWGSKDDEEKVITDPRVIDAMDKMEDYAPSGINPEHSREREGLDTDSGKASAQMEGYHPDGEDTVTSEQKAAYDKLFAPSRESVEYFDFKPEDLNTSQELGRFNGDRRPMILRQDEEWDEGYGLPEIEDVDNPYKFTTGPTGDTDDDVGGVEFIGTNGTTRYTPSEARTKYYRGANR